MRLFDHLFFKQVALIEQNEQIEADFNWKSAKLINKLKQISQQYSARETDQLIKVLNEILFIEVALNVKADGY